MLISRTVCFNAHTFLEVERAKQSTFLMFGGFNDRLGDYTS